MNRIDRISAMLIQLQSRRTVKASDIAARFNISLRTVYRDIKTLEEAGVPLIGEAGIGYSLVEGYRLPPVMFTRDEAAAFLTAEKMIAQLTDTANGESYTSAMYKIKAVLRSVDKDYLEKISNHIEVLKARSQRQTTDKLNPLQSILQSIAEKSVLSICYKAAYKDDVTERLVEPIGVFYLDNYWHMIAWCRLRNDYRDFRFDRLERLTITGQHFDKIHLSLKEHLQKWFKETALISVVIRIKKEAAAYLGEQKYYHGFIAETIKDDVVDMQFLSAHLNGFTRWFMMFADYAVIVEPPELRQQVKEMIEKISKNL